MWEPINFDDISKKIEESQNKIDVSLLAFWNLIKIIPERWESKHFENESTSFWVIAIFGKCVIYYNDIEEGFNISTFECYGEIKNYLCEEFDLNQVLYQIYYSN